MSLNEDQHSFWNEGPGGRTWSKRADDLDTMHEPVTDLMHAALAPEPGMTLLDVGCGAGASTLSFARSVGPEGGVVGLDFARPLLEIAKARAEARGIGNAEFREGDAQTADLSAGRFDAVVSRFGLMFFEDPVAAFANIRASLVPGGRIVFAAWGAAEHNPWFGEASAAAEAHFGPAKPSLPGAPGPTAFADIDRVLDILLEAGFCEGAGAPNDLALHHPGGLATILDLAKVIGPVPGHLRDNDGTREDLRIILDDLGARFRKHVSEDGITIPARVNLFTALAP